MTSKAVYLSGFRGSVQYASVCNTAEQVQVSDNVPLQLIYNLGISVEFDSKHFLHLLLGASKKDCVTTKFIGKGDVAVAQDTM